MTNPERLFLALWPDEDTRARLRAIQKQSRQHYQGRAVNTNNLHLTLRYLGATSDQQKHCVIEQMAGIQCDSFTLQLDKLDGFSRPQILWVGASQYHDTLQSLVNSIQQGLRSCGYATEEASFVPHVSLMRKVRFVTLEPLEPIVWPVHSFALVRSESGREGLHYRVLQQWPLLGST